MSTEFYDPNTFKVGMVVVYMDGMRSELVGTINIITNIFGDEVETRRWNERHKAHEYGAFSTDVEKYKIKIIGEV